MPKRGVVRFDKRESYSRGILDPSRYSRGWVPLHTGWHYRQVYRVFIRYSMLRKYTPDSTHVVDWGELMVDADGTFEKGPVRIMDSRDQVLRRKIVRLVKVLWQQRGVEEATWEREETMRATYPSSFEDEDTFFSHLKNKNE